MIIGSQGDLYLWEATDKDGQTRKYQTHGPNVTEAAMLAHLRKNYPGLKITSLRRADNPTRDYIPPQPDKLGEVKSHAFDFGIRRGLADDFRRMSEGERVATVRSVKGLPDYDPALIAVVVAVRDAQLAEQVDISSIRGRADMVLKQPIRPAISRPAAIPKPLDRISLLTANRRHTMRRQ